MLRGGSGTPLPQWLVVDKVNGLELIDLLCISIGFDLLYFGGEKGWMERSISVLSVMRLNRCKLIIFCRSNSPFLKKKKTRRSFPVSLRPVFPPLLGLEALEPEGCLFPSLPNQGYHGYGLSFLFHLPIAQL